MFGESPLLRVFVPCMVGLSCYTLHKTTITGYKEDDAQLKIPFFRRPFLGKNDRVGCCHVRDMWFLESAVHVFAAVLMVCFDFVHEQTLSATFCGGFLF